MKWWVWALDVLGILHCIVNLLHCRLRREKQTGEKDA